jgi:hypothetical protein
MVFVGCASSISNWELPASHPANPIAEEAKISQPRDPFQGEQSIDPHRLKATQSLYQNSQSEGVSSHGLNHSDHSNNIVHPKNGNKDHSEREDIIHNHKESYQ